MTPGWRRLLRTESGQTAVEYIGVLVVVVSVVVGLALASPGVAASVGSVVKHAICRVGGGTACPKVTASAGGPSAADRAADRAARQRAVIAAIQKAWMAEQAQYQYVHGEPTPEWVAYKKYSSECWYTKASCYAAAVLSLGESLEDAKRMWDLHCGPSTTQQDGCDSGAVVRDHLTEMILIDIPTTLVAGGVVKFIGEKAVFSIGEATIEGGGTAVNVLSDAAAQDLLVSNGFTAARAESFVSSFDGAISVREVQAGEQFLRYTGDPTSSGSFLTSSQFSTPAEAVKSLVLEGRIAGGAEGITQTVVMDPGTFQFSAGQPYP